MMIAGRVCTLVCAVTMMTGVASAASKYITVKVTSSFGDYNSGEGTLLEEKCVLFVKDEGNKDLGLVMGRDEDGYCFKQWNQDLLPGTSVSVLRADVSRIGDWELIKALKKLDAKPFYLEVRDDVSLNFTSCRNITSQRQAVRCLREYGEIGEPEAEMANTVIASSSKMARKSLKKLLGPNQPERLKLVDEAAAVAVVNIHMDEDEFTYYVVAKGENPEITRVHFESLVDLYYDWPAGVQPLDYALGRRGVEGWHYEEFEEARQETTDD